MPYPKKLSLIQLGSSDNPEHHNTFRQWERTTRWLHSLMATGILLQLLLSLVMTSPDQLKVADSVEKYALYAHEYLGLSLFIIICTQWVWLILPRSDISFRHLFPYSDTARHRVITDIQTLWSQRKLPPTAERGGLSGLIHGLGFLTATAMITSGLGLYITLVLGRGADSPLFQGLSAIHGSFAALMWVFLVGHIGAAFWHQTKGDPVISQMFKI